MGITTNGLTQPIADTTTVQSEYYADPDTTVSGHLPLHGLVDSRVGYTGKVGVFNNGLGVSLVDGLAVGKDSILTYPRGSNYQLLTASGQIMAVPGKLSGYFVNSFSSTPTIKIWDALTATGTSVPIDTTTIAATGFVRLPDIRMSTGAYATITGTTSITFFYDPTTT